MTALFTICMHILWMILVHGSVVTLHRLVPFAEETTNALGYVPSVCAHSIVCIITHATSVYYGAVGIYDPSQETDMGAAVIYVLSSSFIYEFILGWYGSKTVPYETVIHHVIGSLLMTYLSRSSMMYWACRLGTMEVSTIFLDIIYVFNCCPGWKKRYARVFYACKIAFACLFLYVRVWRATAYIVSYMMDKDSDQHVWLTRFVFATMVQQYYWAVLVVSKLYSTLAGFT